MDDLVDVGGGRVQEREKPGVVNGNFSGEIQLAGQIPVYKEVYQIGQIDMERLR